MDIEHHVSENIDNSNESTIIESTVNSTLNDSAMSANNVGGILIFIFTVEKADFNAMVIHKTYIGEKIKADLLQRVNI